MASCSKCRFTSSSYIKSLFIASTITTILIIHFYLSIKERESEISTVHLQQATSIIRGPTTKSVNATPIYQSHSRVNILKPEFKSIPNSRSKLLSAYYDNRDQFYGPSVIILGYQVRKTWDRAMYCTLYYSNGSTHCSQQDSATVELADSCNKYIRYANMISVSYVCKLPTSSVPIHVSLSIEPCSRTINPVKLLVLNQPESLVEKEEFGMCVQTPLYGRENLQNLYEFVEIHRLLGVKVFTIYTQIKLEEFAAGLKVYGNELDINIIEWSGVFKRTDPVHYYGEILSIHDCLYRSRHKVKYLAFIDLDEVIAPRQDNSLGEMMKRVVASPSAVVTNGNTVAGYIINNVLMSTRNTIPTEDLKLMQERLCNKIRVPKYFTMTKRYVCEYKHPRRSKVIVYPDKVSHLDIHSICRHGKYSKQTVPISVGALYHYRNIVPADCKNQSLSNANELTLYFRDEMLTQLNKRLCN